MDANLIAQPGEPRRRQVLGRGLGALIPGGESTRSMISCRVDQILPPLDQPRAAINPASLRELSESIRESGVLQPVLLTRDGARFRLIAGERRWRAAKLAGLTHIPAMIRQVDADEAFALALIENVQREDLTPLEEALAYRRLIDEHGFTQKQLAAKIGKARSTIANTLRLLDLPPPVQGQVQQGALSAGHARAVLGVPEADRVAFAERLIDEKASVRQAEAKARREPKRVASAQVAEPHREERRANLRLLERRLREALHTRAVIHDRGGSGRVELFYSDDAMLQTIVDRLLEMRR